MPSIKQNKEQQLALDDVTAKLELLQALDSDDLSGVTILLDGTGRKKPIKITLSSGDKEMRRVYSVIADYKKRLAKDIREKGKKHDIDFSEEEQRLLSGAAKNLNANADAGELEGDEALSQGAQSPEEDARLSQQGDNTPRQHFPQADVSYGLGGAMFRGNY